MMQPDGPTTAQAIQQIVAHGASLLQNAQGQQLIDN
jgi:hypothetical protein